MHEWLVQESAIHIPTFEEFVNMGRKLILVLIISLLGFFMDRNLDLYSLSKMLFPSRKML